LAGWFPTRPLVFEVKPPFAGKAGRDIIISEVDIACLLQAKAAIAAGLAKGQDVRESIEAAHRYLLASIRYSFPLGKGRRPLNHFVKT